MLNYLVRNTLLCATGHRDRSQRAGARPKNWGFVLLYTLYTLHLLCTSTVCIENVAIKGEFHTGSVITILTTLCFSHKHHYYPNHKLELAHFHFTGRIGKFRIPVYWFAHNEPQNPAFMENAYCPIGRGCVPTNLNNGIVYFELPTHSNLRTSLGNNFFEHFCFSVCQHACLVFCAWLC
jgi:hypothetical protein